MELAPIVLFVYNRPWHTRRTLESLAKNELANQSRLYIYADGPKPAATEQERNKIAEVRNLLQEKEWCKEVRIIEQKQNKGLANSIIEGVTEVITKHEKVIVLEDDLITAAGFLKFMNESLSMFSNRNLAGVTGWSFEIKNQEKAYLSRIGACWGWGTWKDVWLNINFDTLELINKIEELKLKTEFNADDHYPYFDMLVDQLNGKIDSWAIRFYAHYFIQQKLFLLPPKSLVLNIGKDGSGAHEQISKVADPNFDPNGRFTVDKDLSIDDDSVVRKQIVTSSLYIRPTEESRAVRKIKSMIKLWKF